jgi:DNA-binding transcriptional ArsR family regulator
MGSGALRRTRALDGFELVAESGRVIAVLGPNGGHDDVRAEPQRREILVLLRAGERPVTELAQELGMAQPGASKHLRVLREVGLVRDRKAGKQRLYGLDARGLRPVHEWTGGFERFWNESFDRLDAYVQDLKQARQEE